MRATIVYGFLGAGKTTLLRSLVPRLASVESTALLVNEFGIEGVDQVVLASDDLTVRQLVGGCVCCEVRGDLMVALDEIARVVGPDRLVIEPTGLASPDTLAHVFASPSVRSIVLVDSIITVLDATRCALVRDHLGEFFPNQVRHADLVLVNKSDAASEAERRDARAWARSLNPGAAIVDTMYCNVDPDLLLAAVRQGRVRRAEPGDDVDLNVNVPHDDLAASGLERLVLDTGALPAERVDTFVCDLAAGVYGDVVRAKGFVPDADGCALVDVVLGAWEVRAFGPAPLYIDVIGRNLNTNEMELALTNGIKELARTA
ncbi:MAG: GTP-binding protein [Chloroflexota bacterium]|nr:GTP-binding protein [Chloroflexota bacterium]